MSASYVALFSALALASLLAARRDRAFALVALAALTGLLPGLIWGIDSSLDGISLGRVFVAAATTIAIGEAVGLPPRLARLTRIGVRSPDRDFDFRLWRAIGPTWSMLQTGAEAEGGMRPEYRRELLRSMRQAADRLERLQPPSDAWRSVRDGYVEAVRAAQGMLIDGASEVEQLRTFREAGAPAFALTGQLRAAYVPNAPPSPPWAVIAFILVFSLVVPGALDVADYAVETINPPPVAVGWKSMAIPFSNGDAWAGNALSDGSALYLMSREQVDGFWGVLRVRSSSDAGLTWSPPGAASITDVPEIARPAMALAPDGSLWEAMVHVGDEPETQRLFLNRSTDGGATWLQGFARASPLTTGLVGLPCLLVTPDVQLVAFTDGATGAAMIQPLLFNRVNPQPIGDPITLGTTNRQLYSDANFLDAGFALAARGRYVVALWHPSDEVINVSISDDAGRTWRAAPPLTTQARPDRPHLAVVDGTFVALDVRSNGSTGGSRLQIDTSGDGQRWTGGTIVSDGLAATEGVLDVSDGTWRLLYAACPGIVHCVTPPRVWYRESRDGHHWTDPQALTVPKQGLRVIGVGEAGSRMWAIWQRGADAAPEQRVIEGMIH